MEVSLVPLLQQDLFYQVKMWVMFQLPNTLTLNPNDAISFRINPPSSADLTVWYAAVTLVMVQDCLLIILMQKQAFIIILQVFPLANHM